MSDVPALQINVLTNPAQVSEFWAWLTRPGRTYVAADTETTGLDWWNPTFKVRLIQFGDVEGGWAIPLQGWSTLIKGALEWCSTARVKIVWHNLAFDSLALRAEDIKLDWTIQEDTFVYAALGGYAEHARTLKGCAQREFGGWAGAGERLLKTGMTNAGWGWDNVPLDWKPYPLYGVVDTCITAGLWELWEPRRKRWAADHALEIAAIRLTGNMAWRGLPVDGAYIFTQIEDHEKQEAEVRSRLDGMGITNPHQNGQLELVLRSAGVDLTQRTEKGKIQLDADVLGKIDHPAARDVLEFRRLYKQRTSYLEPLFNGAGGQLGYGLVHPEIRSIEARTGRMSVSSPPLQQLPAEDPTVRRGIVSRDVDTEDFVSADFGQIELRLWAAINHDQPMLDALAATDATGSDFFVELGKTVYHDPGFTKADHRRQLLKATTYTKLFGGGVEKAATAAGVDVYDLIPTWKALEQSYPSLETLGSNLIETRRLPDGSLEHVATSPWGREFRVKDQQERRKLGNYVTQGSAAIALKKALVGLEAAGFGDYMLLPVHDEVCFSIPKQETTEAMQEISEVMNAVIDPERWGIPVKAKPKAGRDWSEVH